MQSLCVGIRNQFSILVSFGYLIFNYGFMLIMIPPIGNVGIPIGEAVLILYFLSTNWINVLNRLATLIPVVPFLVWWVLGFSRLIIDFYTHGIWALRDATHLIESLYLLVGLIVFRNHQMREYFFKLIPAFVIFAISHSATYFFSDSIRQSSPSVTSAAGSVVPILYTHINTPQILLWCATYFLLDLQTFRTNNFAKFFLVSILISFAVFIFQSRTVYLQLIGIFLVFSVYQKHTIKIGIITLAGVSALLTLAPYVGIELIGRLGQATSPQFLLNHMLSISGQEIEGVEASAGGVIQRLGWWLNIYYLITENHLRLFFGLGYGIPLVDLNVGHNMAREPHNSYVSIVARLGVIGILSWLAIHLFLVRIWHFLFKHHTNEVESKRLLFIFFYFVLVWINALGEDAFEKPFFTVPYYFLWGYVLSLMYEHKLLLSNEYKDAQ